MDASENSCDVTMALAPSGASSQVAFAKRVAVQLNRVARKFGFEIRRFAPPARQDFDNWMYYGQLLQTGWERARAGAADPFELQFVDYALRRHRLSKSQIFQDLLVLLVLREKRGGFFVEFGATNGISLSNTYLLEAAYAWRGILAEPARIWHRALRDNRRAVIDTRCVWARTGKMLHFNEALASELSTIDRYSDRDSHRQDRAGHRYAVETVSLNDLLRAHDAPRKIDYLSIDTEGSELAILEAFDFAAYDIGVMTVEHNYATPDRERIAALLAPRGFRQVLGDYSLFDDWYVQERLLAAP